MRKSKLGILASAIMIGSMAIPVLGQAAGGDAGGGNPPADNGGGGGGGGRQRGQNGGGGGGGGGFQNFRQQMMDRMKADLGSSDDEFAALQPKIEAVMTSQRDANGGRGFGGGGGRRGGGGGGGGGFGGGQQGPQSDVQTKAADLRTVLDNKDAKPEEIKEKLEALRAAKAKAKEDLAKAQADLKGLLTQRQEAVLVGYGMLD